MKTLITTLIILLALVGCKKQEQLIQTIDIVELDYSVSFENKTSNVYVITSEHFNIELQANESKILRFSSTYDNVKSFYIDYKVKGTNVLSQYKPIRNDKTKVFNIIISGGLMHQ